MAQLMRRGKTERVAGERNRTERLELIRQRDDAVMEVKGRQMEKIFLWEDDFLWSLTKTKYSETETMHNKSKIEKNYGWQHDCAQVHVTHTAFK